MRPWMILQERLMLNQMPPLDRLADAIELHQIGELSRAAELYRKTINRYPKNADAWHLLGLIAHQQKNNKLAVKLIKTAIDIQPNTADFHNNLGRVYTALGNDMDYFEYRRSIELNPNHVKALSNLAGSLRSKGEFYAAIDYAIRAAKIDPEDEEAHNNLGNALKDINKIEDAIIAYNRAIELNPDYALAHWNLSLALLTLGRYEEGFKEMMWRWKWDGFASKLREFNQPRLTKLIGSDNELSGKSLLLYAEQGLGDTIHFIRYAALFRQIDVNVIFECPEALIPLLKNSNLVDQIISPGSKLPKFDFHAPLLDLPFLFKTCEDDIPQTIPYLVVPSHISNKWKQKIDNVEGFKVGINWQGNNQSPVERFRRILPADLEKLASINGVVWFSLQKGSDHDNTSKFSDNFPIIETGSEALIETAGLIQTLDLVITSDTAIAHLAGSLGKPVWILLHHSPDWRWRTTGSINSWYPSARLFRQSKPGNWETVIEEVFISLKNTI